MDKVYFNKGIIDKADPRSKYLAVFYVLFVISAELGLSYMYCLLATGLFFAYNLVRSRWPRLYTSDKLFVLMFLVMVANIRPETSRSLTYWLYWMIGLGFAVFYTRSSTNMKPLMIVWLILSLYAVFIVLFSKADITLFTKTIGRFYTDSAKAYNAEHMRDGYSAAVGSSISYTCYYLVGGIAAVLCLPLKKTVKIILGGGILFALLITGRRGETLAALFALLVYFYFSASKNKRTKRILIIILGLAFAAFLVYAFWPVLKELPAFARYSQTVSNIKNDKDISSSRFVIYEIAFNVFLEHPVFGVGWQCFYQFLPDYFDLLNVHNIYLQLLCETGVVGTAFILAPFIVLLCKSIRLLNYYSIKQNDAVGKQICLFSVIMQIFFLLCGMLDNPLFKPIIGMFYSVMIICVNNAETSIIKGNEALSAA